MGISVPFYLFRKYEREVVVVHHEDFKEDPYDPSYFSEKRRLYYDETKRFNSLADAQGLTDKSWENTSEDQKAKEEFDMQFGLQVGAAAQSQGGFGYSKTTAPAKATPTAPANDRSSSDRTHH